MIVFTARLKALPGKEGDASEAIASMTAAVHAQEPGALVYVCHTSPESPGEYLFYEVYADEAAHETHMNTPHFAKLMETIGPVFDSDFGVQVENLTRLCGFFRA
jgi:quinol monooxygenase YgiN